MKIDRSNSFDDITDVKLKLNSIELALHNYISSSFRVENDSFPFDNNTLKIEFKDSYEIDMFIEILKRFKKEVEESFGYWENQHE